MNDGASLLLAFLVVAWPVLLLVVIALRRRVRLWVRLERLHFGKLTPPEAAHGSRRRRSSVLPSEQKVIPFPDRRAA